MAWTGTARVAVVLALAAGVPAARAQEVIKIAAGAPITGELAKQGQEVVNAVRLAVDHWNKNGGVLGKKVEVLEADDQGDPLGDSRLACGPHLARRASGQVYEARGHSRLGAPQPR